MKFQNGGDLLVRRLFEHGVTTFFSIIGGQMGTIYDALTRFPKIDVITPRSETGAALMACGYAASKGTPAVTMSTVGAGVVYELPGIALAWMHYLPVISISPQVQSWKIKPHQESLQACNQDELYSPFTKWNTIVYHWARIPDMVDRGFREALCPAPGPVHIDIPVDILFSRKLLTERTEKRLFPKVEHTRYMHRIPCDRKALSRAVSCLRSAKQPVILMGGGMGRQGRHPEIRDRLSGLNIPVVTSGASTGSLNRKSPSYAGRLETLMEKSPSILQDADILLVMGMDREILEAVSILRKRGKEKEPALIQMETTPLAFYPAEDAIHLLCNPSTGLFGLFPSVKEQKNHTDAAPHREKDDSFSHLEGVLANLSTDADIIVQDFFPDDPEIKTLVERCRAKDAFLLPEKHLAGAGLPFAIGASIASPGARVFLVTETKNLMHHIREVWTMVTKGVNLVILCADKKTSQEIVCPADRMISGFKCPVFTYDPEKGMKSMPGRISNPGPFAVIFPWKE